MDLEVLESDPIRGRLDALRRGGSVTPPVAGGGIVRDSPKRSLDSLSVFAGEPARPWKKNSGGNLGRVGVAAPAAAPAAAAFAAFPTPEPAPRSSPASVHSPAIHWRAVPTARKSAFPSPRALPAAAPLPLQRADDDEFGHYLFIDDDSPTGTTLSPWGAPCGGAPCSNMPRF